MGAEGIQGTRLQLALGTFFAGKSPKLPSCFQTFKVDRSLPRFLWPGVPPVRELNSIPKKKKCTEFMFEGLEAPVKGKF